MQFDDDDIYDYIETENKKSTSILEKFFKQQAVSAQDRNHISRTDVEGDIYPAYNDQLPSFPKKPPVRLGWNNINLICSEDRGLFNVSLASRKRALLVQEEVFRRQLRDELQQRVIVGRLVQNSLTFDAKLPLYLQSFSKQMTKQLQLSALDSYYLYPGQVVAVQVENEDQPILDVTAIHALNETPAIDVTALGNIHMNDALAVVIACGPFTNEDSLRYLYLIDLIAKIKSRQLTCDLLVLLGPLVSETNSIQDVEFDVLYEMVVQLVVDELPDLKIVIVDSPHDITNLHPMPQPEKQSKHSNVRFASNPCHVEVNELKIAIINTDVFMDMKQKSLIKGDEIRKNPISWICQAIIEQRSFHPVYPSSEPLDQSKINEDLSLAWRPTSQTMQHLSIQVLSRQSQCDSEPIYLDELVEMAQTFTAPTIFVAPSLRLHQFIRETRNCIFVNPGLIKTKSTVAHVVYHSKASKNALQGTRVEIVPI